MWFEVLFEGVKNFAGEIIGAILIAIFWWKFPRLRGWVRRQLESEQGNVNPVEAQRSDEVQRQLEAQRQELERAKVSKQRPAMSDYDFRILCTYGTASEVEEAIMNGANINAKDDFGLTALTVAVALGRT